MVESLYVIEQGSYLARNGDRLDIMKQGALLESIPAKDLNKLVLTGYVSLSGPVMDYLIRNRIPDLLFCFPFSSAKSGFHVYHPEPAASPGPGERASVLCLHPADQ